MSNLVGSNPTAFINSFPSIFFIGKENLFFITIERTERMPEWSKGSALSFFFCMCAISALHMTATSELFFELFGGRGHVGTAIIPRDNPASLPEVFRAQNLLKKTEPLARMSPWSVPSHPDPQLAMYRLVV